LIASRLEAVCKLAQGFERRANLQIRAKTALGAAGIFVLAISRAV